MTDIAYWLPGGLLGAYSLFYFLLLLPIDLVVVLDVAYFGAALANKKTVLPLLRER